MTTGTEPTLTPEFHRGARKAASRLARKLIPSMPVPEPENELIKREAYQLAKASRHKPWARRYLRSLGRLR